MTRALHFTAVLLTGLALGPGLAHLLELPNKIDLPADAYLQVQQIYRGWALLGLIVLPQVAVCGTLAWRLRGGRPGFGLAVTAFLCAAGAQAVFWAWTAPAKASTAQWTMLPTGWQALRAQWEYSHAACAVLNLAALVFLVGGAFRRR
jgi:hypothetical protein